MWHFFSVVRCSWKHVPRPIWSGQRSVFEWWALKPVTWLLYWVSPCGPLLWVSHCGSLVGSGSYLSCCAFWVSRINLFVFSWSILASSKPFSFSLPLDLCLSLLKSLYLASRHLFYGTLSLSWYPSSFLWMSYLQRALWLSPLSLGQEAISKSHSFMTSSW